MKTIKQLVIILLTVTCLSLTTITFISCAAIPAIGVTTIIGQIEQWAVPIADQWIQNWIHTHFGVSKSAEASLEDQFVAQKRAAAQAQFPGVKATDIDAGLRSAYQKSVQK